jgi:pimeloyl-ACP methyl ester carboxylesterase
MKKKIIFIPALLCDERLFSYQVSFLENFFEVDVFIPKKFDDISVCVDFFIEKYKKFENINICGVSMGGYIAMEILKQQADIVDKVCFIGTSYLEDAFEKKEARIRSIENVNKDGFHLVTENMIKNSIIFNSENKILVDLIKDMANNIGIDGFVNQQKLILSRKNSINLFKNMLNPCLLIVGKNDLITTVDLFMEMFDVLKNSNAKKFCKLEIIEECGHLPVIEKPKKINEILKEFFL